MMAAFTKSVVSAWVLTSYSTTGTEEEDSESEEELASDEDVPGSDEGEVVPESAEDGVSELEEVPGSGVVEEELVPPLQPTKKVAANKNKITFLFFMVSFFLSF